ncbi:hypothetical protein CRI93_01495 [Longimonas halophila]|uniref:Uncharacterized protein n=1 Tax=Longimonas halophila TaxID=1469170 RepID=A0A2H3PAY1_9BACT|nr:hypothetical protein CRI93_01495 [Longimonas halophila]
MYVCRYTWAGVSLLNLEVDYPGWIGEDKQATDWHLPQKETAQMVAPSVVGFPLSWYLFSVVQQPPGTSFRPLSEYQSRATNR